MIFHKKIVTNMDLGAFDVLPASTWMVLLDWPILQMTLTVSYERNRHE